MAEVATRQSACAHVCVYICVCACGAASLSPAPAPNPGSLQCQPHSVNTQNLFPFAIFFLFQGSLRDSQSDTVFSDWHIGEAMLDVATSDDANDWPWGNDLLRQGERKKRGKERESYVSIKQWQLKKRDSKDAL